MTDEKTTRLAQAIAARRDMAVRLVQEMVQRPSVESELEVGKYIGDWLQERGIDPDVWEPEIEDIRDLRGFVDLKGDYRGRPNLVAVIRGTGGGRSLALNGHMDVVPVEEAPWSHGGPWSGAYMDGKVYGRGAVDMKAGIAEALVLVDALQACGIQLKGDLQLHFVVDEENGGNGTLAALGRGYTADGFIFLESTGTDTVLVANRGAQFFRISVPGVEAGVMFMQANPNAIEKAMFLFQAVQRYSTQRTSQANHPLYASYPQRNMTKIPLAVCKIQAGSWPSTLPARCVMEGTIECLPGEDIHQVKEEFRSYLLDVARDDSWLKDHLPIIEWFGLWFEASANDLSNPMITTLVSACKQVTGREPQLLGTGGCDLRLPLLNQGIPSVLFGPGGSPLHVTDEYVDIDSLMESTQVLGRFVLEWCGAA